MSNALAAFCNPGHLDFLVRASGCGEELLISECKMPRFDFTLCTHVDCNSLLIQGLNVSDSSFALISSSKTGTLQRKPTVACLTFRCTVFVPSNELYFAVSKLTWQQDMLLLHLQHVSACDWTPSQLCLTDFCQSQSDQVLNNTLILASVLLCMAHECRTNQMTSGAPN